MASPTLQDWFVVKLTLYSLADGSNTSYSFSNRPVLNDSTALYLPLLEEINGLGARMSDYMPFPLSGSIVLNDERGSFGFERRFSDVLDRYTIINQTVEIYAAQTEYDDQDVTADLVSVYTAKVLSWKRDKDNQKLTIQIAATPIDPRIVTRLIDTATFPSAPSSAIGRFLPVVFGQNVEVAGIRVDPDGTASPKFAYATTLATTFPVGGVQTYYTKEKVTGKYLAVSSASAVATPVLTQSTAGGLARSLSGNYEEFATAIGSGYVITAGRVLFVNTSGGWTAGTDSKIYFNIYKLSPLTGLPETRVGQATRLKSAYQTQFRAGSDFYIEFAFSEPVVLNSPDGYVLGIAQSVDSTAGTGTGDNVSWRSDGTHAVYGWYLYNGATSLGSSTKNWVKVNATRTDTDPVYDFYGCKFTDTKSSAAGVDGLGYAYFTVTQHTGISSDYGTPDLTKLDFIVAANGFTDDVSGTISGTPSALLTLPKQCIAVLDRRYSGGSWVAGSFDPSKFSNTHHSNVVIAGATSGRAYADQVMREICRNSASRLVYMNSPTKIGLWMFGVNNPSVANYTFTQERVSISSAEKRGIETITNRISMYFDKRLRDLDIVRGATDGQFRNYFGSLNWYPTLNDTTRAIAGASETIYGARPLDDQTYDFIASTSSAEWVARYLLITGAFEDTYALIECDWFENKALEMLDVVDILSPELPAFYGTSPNAHLPTFAGTETDLLGGNYLARAKPYRGQIEEKALIFRKGAAPRLRLTCHLLTDSPQDPT